MSPDPPFATAAPRRILVVKLSSFGDIVLVTAGLRALKRAWPAADLRVAVEQRWAPVLAACDDVDGVFEAPTQSSIDLRETLRIARTLRADRRKRGPWDLALDFQGTRRSAAWIYLSRARVKAGRGHPRPGWRVALPLDRTQHAVRNVAELCERIGVAASDLSPSLRTRSTDETSLDAVLDREGLPRRGFVLLNAASRWPSKGWASDKAAALARRIAERSGEPVVVTGGAEESEVATEIVRRARGGAISLAGRLSLGEALCLIARARLMVSCDSGPMHAAAALGVPVVALFGPTLPEHTGPWGEGHRVVQASRPGHHHEYRSVEGSRHMDALGIEPVAEAVFDMLRTAPARAASLP